MSNADLLRKYVDILEYGKHLTTAESEIYSSVVNNPELAPIVKAINETFPKEARYAVIKKYEQQLNAMQPQNELDKIKQACQNAYGISLDNIEFKKLSNGKDIIAFYDPRLNRKRLIDYSYAKSLVGEFTDVQNSNDMFQTDDYEKNATNIAKTEAANNTNRELNMIDIEMFKTNYNDLIKRIPSDEQYKVEMVNKLLNQSESRNIKYINIENMVALDKDGTIIEASLSRDNEVQVSSASDIKRNVSSMDNNGNVTYTNDATFNSAPIEATNSEITPTDFEQQEEIVDPEEQEKEENFKIIIQEEMDKHNIYGSVDEVFEKVKYYTEDMTKLENDFENKTLNDNQYEFYNALCESYINANTLEKGNSMTLTYTNSDISPNGFIFTIVLAVIAMIIGLVILIAIKM
jgi:hypothetical protein